MIERLVSILEELIASMTAVDGHRVKVSSKNAHLEHQIPQGAKLLSHVSCSAFDVLSRQD